MKTIPCPSEDHKVPELISKQYCQVLIWQYCFDIILPSTNLENNANFSEAGEGEDLFSTDKSKEQLYIEAKHVLNLVEPYTTSKRPQEINGISVSPPQTVPRKPPRHE